MGWRTSWSLVKLKGPSRVSIDPFFFQVPDTAPADDFYVRDWIDNAASADDGVEPSTHPYFYVPAYDNAMLAGAELPELIENTNAASGGGRDGGAENAQSGERTPAIDETGIEHDVNAVVGAIGGAVVRDDAGVLAVLPRLHPGSDTGFQVFDDRGGDAFVQRLDGRVILRMNAAR